MADSEQRARTMTRRIAASSSKESLFPGWMILDSRDGRNPLPRIRPCFR